MSSCYFTNVHIAFKHFLLFFIKLFFTYFDLEKSRLLKEVFRKGRNCERV